MLATRNRDTPVLHHRQSIPLLQTGGSASTDTSTSVQVALRIRPVTGHDQSSIPSRWQRTVVQPLSLSTVQVDASGQAPPGGTPVAPGANKRQAFTFDRVLGPIDGQEQVYNNSVMPLVSRFLEGYNVTVLAYGQTSSGKSYTMGTAVGDADFESLIAGQRPDPQIGIIPRSVAQIFSEMKTNQAAKSGSIQYTARASFIEIYNEELIDLLAEGEGDNRPLVQIREDKSGQIIWSGLREVKVQNVADVMNRLLQGSSIRRTNETDMNAQSSRSHAIFSLTLIQRKYVGSGIPSIVSTSGIRPPSSFGARSQTPNGGRTTPTGRSSALFRPASTAIPGAFKFGSPSRSVTPAGSTSLSLRPSSVLSTPGRSSPMPDDRGASSEAGEWVTVTSKFHFVDLAGSERLKRTAAQGERVKEGISINSGLHALGNVISALGDPAKSKRTTHIPYRDSKLTRLLQDSLGGNAHTLMIACVSPTEYNVSETLNTLQYANRARNIKNKAELNEVENGWDDVDYLQGQVTKLRKELVLLKGFKAGTPGNEAALKVVNQRETLEWQSKYATISQKCSQLTAEKIQLQQQLSRENLTQEEYYRAAEPVIIEYEKTVDALEGQINLQKAALGHCEDVILEHESMARDMNEKATELERDLEGREKTVIELQARLSKLEDREASAESYARDLEGRLSQHTASGAAEASVVTELRREVSRLKENDGKTEQYIRDLEVKLTKSEESSIVLQEQISRLERDLTRREDAYKELHQRMEMLDKSEEHRALARELDARDATVLSLEDKIETLQIERDEITRERGKLTDAAASRQLEKGKMEDRIKELENELLKLKGSNTGVKSRGEQEASLANGMIRPGSHNTRDAPSSEYSSVEEEMGFLQTQVDMLTEELQSHQELSSKLKEEMTLINAKYKEALAEVKDLTGQLQETKLSIPDTPDGREFLTPGESPSISRKGSYNFASTSGLRARGRPESLLLEKSPGRRKSLSRRSSGSFLGYNPKESTPREGTNMTTTSAPAMPILQIAANGVNDGTSTLFRTQSLSQSTEPDITLGGRRKLSLSGSADFAKLGFSPENGFNGSLPSNSPLNYERKIASLEAETLRLQEALRERDEELANFENKMKQGEYQAILSNGKMESRLTNGVHAGIADEETNGLDELMRTMARKETEASQEIEKAHQKMSQMVKEKEVSQSILENQVANLVKEVETLQSRELAMSAELEAARSREEQQSISHKEMLESVQASHVKDVILLKDGLQREHDLKVGEMKENHREMVHSIQLQHENAMNSAIDSMRQKHLATLGESEAESAQRQDLECKELIEQHAEQLQNIKDTHVKTLEDQISAHAVNMTELQSKHDEELYAIRKAVEEHKKLANSAQALSLTELHDQHSKALDDATSTHVKALDALRSEHRTITEESMRLHQFELSQLKEEHKLVLENMTTEQAETNEISKAEQMNIKRDLERMQQNHLHALEQLETLKGAHSEKLREMSLEHANRVEELESSLNEAITTRNALATTHEELHQKYQRVKEQQPDEIDNLKAELAETNDALVTLEAALTEAQEERDRLNAIITSKGTSASGSTSDREITKGAAQSQKEIDLLQANLANVRSELQRCKSDIQGMLEDKTRQESTLREMKIRLTIAETRSALASSRGMQSPEHNSNGVEGADRPSNLRRESADTETSRSSRNLSVVGGSKPPPLTPPPNMPPPPTPSATNGASTPTQMHRNSVGMRSSNSSSSFAPLQPDSPGGILTSSSSSTSINSPNGIAMVSSESKTVKMLSDQAEELKSLAKQLNHCEMDLQANIDLVATLEAALNDSERNLRKSRLQLSEATRERDRYSNQVEDLRLQLNQAQQETDVVRNSVMIEKQSFESKLQMEREAKDNARRALEARLEKVQKKKGGKLLCM